MLRSQVVAEARRWIGTPFHHQGRLRGVGVDCVGLIVGVAVALGIDVRDRAAYPRLPYRGELTRALAEQLVHIEIGEACPADVLELAWQPARQSMHVALLTEHGILHATEEIGSVVEHRLDDVWRSRIRAAWRFPGIED